MPARRYNEEEVAAIIQRATEAPDAPQRQMPATEGMTLAQIQEIGREVGVSPDVIARAAAALDQVAKTSTRRMLGIPIGVRHSVELERKITDAEWERLVSDLRDTFDATGYVMQSGSLREWRNGNLSIAIEPTPAGDRIRMRTTNDLARTWMLGGTVVSAAAVFNAIAALSAHHPGKLAVSALLLAVSGGLFGLALTRVLPWARLRRAQMKELAERLIAAAPALPSGDSAGSAHRDSDE